MTTRLKQYREGHRLQNLLRPVARRYFEVVPPDSQPLRGCAVSMPSVVVSTSGSAVKKHLPCHKRNLHCRNAEQQMPSWHRISVEGVVLATHAKIRLPEGQVRHQAFRCH